MLDFDGAFKHKWVKYSVYAVCGIGAAYIGYRMIGGGGSAASTAVSSATGLSDAQAADMTQMSLQQNSISAQATSQASAQSYGLATSQLNDQTSLTALANNNQTQIALAGVQLQGLQSTLTAQTTQQSNAITGTVTQAQILANEQTAISNNQTQVALAQTNNAAAVATDSIHNTAMTSQNVSNNNLLTSAGNNLTSIISNPSSILSVFGL